MLVTDPASTYFFNGLRLSYRRNGKMERAMNLNERHAIFGGYCSDIDSNH